jgi:hypothetical protein
MRNPAVSVNWCGHPRPNNITKSISLSVPTALSNVEGGATPNEIVNSFVGVEGKTCEEDALKVILVDLIVDPRARSIGCATLDFWSR